MLRFNLQSYLQITKFCFPCGKSEILGTFYNLSNSGPTQYSLLVGFAELVKHKVVFNTQW